MRRCRHGHCAARPDTRAGFSLVEIALAIGVAAVALVSALGLLGVALDANAVSARDTAIVSASSQVMNDLRSAASFDGLWAAEPRKAGFVAKPAGASGTPADSVYYFSEDGRVVTAASPDAFFVCTVRKFAALPQPSERIGPSNLLRVQLVFSWPAGAKPVPRNQRIIHGSIARF